MFGPLVATGVSRSLIDKTTSYRFIQPIQSVTLHRSGVRRNLAVVPAMENKRGLRFAARKVLYPAEKNEMVAAWILCFITAFEPGATTLN